MARTALLYAAAAAVIAAGWLALEETGALYGEALWVAVLALAPALAPDGVRAGPRSPSLATRARRSTRGLTARCSTRRAGSGTACSSSTT